MNLSNEEAVLKSITVRAIRYPRGIKLKTKEGIAEYFIHKTLYFKRFDIKNLILTASFIREINKNDIG